MSVRSGMFHCCGSHWCRAVSDRAIGAVGVVGVKAFIVGAIRVAAVGASVFEQ